MPVRPVIEVDQLNVSYGEFHAVMDLSFQVERGELYALLDTNGAGKTSTLVVTEGHRTASAGTVRVFGKRPADRRAVRPRMGIMLQESGFAADLTVVLDEPATGLDIQSRDALWESQTPGAHAGHHAATQSGCHRRGQLGRDHRHREPRAAETDSARWLVPAARMFRWEPRR